jgi:hypothetical protein
MENHHDTTRVMVKMHPQQYAKLKASSGTIAACPNRKATEANSPAFSHAEGNRSPPEHYVKPVLTTIRGTRTITGLGNTSVWDLIRRDELETVKFGRRRMVVIASIHRLIERRVIRKVQQTEPTAPEITEAPVVPKRRPNGKAKPKGRRASKAKSAA